MVAHNRNNTHREKQKLTWKAVAFLHNHVFLVYSVSLEFAKESETAIAIAHYLLECTNSE